jgi:hypothetical protein
MDIYRRYRDIYRKRDMEAYMYNTEVYIWTNILGENMEIHIQGEIWRYTREKYEYIYRRRDLAKRYVQEEMSRSLFTGREM